MNFKRLKNIDWTVYSFLFILSVIMIMLFNHDSPVYHYNQWVDTNYYFTVARGMLHGKTMYVGVFDQKGPVVYFVHCLALLIMPTKYWGMVPIFIILFFLDLVIVFHWSKLYLKKIPSILVSTTFSILFFNFDYYQRGDSAEELVMPFLLYAFYLLFRYIKTNRLPSNFEYVISGFGISWIFLSKFSLLLGPATIFVIVWVYLLVNRHILWLIKSITYSAIGFVLGMLPTVVYFLANHAIGALWHYYIYLNLFLYTPYDLQYKTSLAKWVGVWFAKSSTWFGQFWLTTLIIAIGILALVASKKIVYDNKRLSIALIAYFALYLSVALPALTSYYYLAILPLAVPGLIALVMLGGKAFRDRLPVSMLVVLLAVVPIAASVFNQSVSKESRFNRLDNEPSAFTLMKPMLDAKVGRHSLMLYKAYDGGFYNITQTVPTEKYFAKYNITREAMPEIYNSMDAELKSGKKRFVVTDALSVEEAMKLNPDYRVVSTLKFSNWPWEQYSLLELKK